MDQKDHMFLPETLVMRLGDSVRFLNSESALHNVRCLETDPPLHVNLALGGTTCSNLIRPMGLAIRWILPVSFMEP